MLGRGVSGSGVLGCSGVVSSGVVVFNVEECWQNIILLCCAILYCGVLCSAECSVQCTV